MSLKLQEIIKAPYQEKQIVLPVAYWNVLRKIS
ncbi:hypothetical protein HDF26_002549 [Pedobacter cryoconitis]|nr:hypothetical protein [Pedobacter cryoconitis]